MKLQVMSDLHLEFHADGGEGFIKALDPKGVDILVLAGDILSLRFYKEAHVLLSAFCAKYPKVIYIPGNHEYYRSDPDAVSHLLAALEHNISNLYILEPGKIEIFDGQRFLGGTMWFGDDGENVRYKHMLNDFYQIKFFVPWVYEQNKEFMSYMSKQLQPGDVVISHHLPSLRSVPPRFEDSQLNRFFVYPAAEMLIHAHKPKLWIHGHSHDASDYMIGDCRVLSNPLGYPSEYSGAVFKDRLIVDV